MVGAGRWGRLHASKWAATPGVRLAAIVDRQFARARDAARVHPGALPLRSIDELPPTISACSVAVDLDALGSVTGRLIARGVHVLAEKPLAMSVVEAEALHVRV